MTLTVAEKEPLKFIIGTTVIWKRTDMQSDFPGGTWTLTYDFIMDGEHFQVEAADDSDDFLVTIAIAVTELLTAGIYKWTAFVDDGTVRYAIDDYGYRGHGTLEVLADYGDETDGLDDRSHAKKVLDDLEAVLEGKASQDKLAHSYTLNGETQSMTKMTWTELREARDAYKREYKAEQDAEKVARGEASGRKIKVRFGTP